MHCALVPTTLLGAIDAAIGGKTAVNVGGKNLVGIFRHPERIVIDIGAIAAAPRDVTREGHAEAIKAGLIADPALFELYETAGEGIDLGEVVRRAVAVKASVVSEDFTEQGKRIILNYGHTVGHALEAAAGLPHGHAVSLGMVVAGHIAAQQVGFDHTGRQKAVLSSVGLPIVARGIDADQIEQLIGLDKKRDDAGLRMVLLEDIGRPIVVPVDATTVLAGLRAIDPG